MKIMRGAVPIFTVALFAALEMRAGGLLAIRDIVAYMVWYVPSRELHAAGAEARMNV